MKVFLVVILCLGFVGAKPAVVQYVMDEYGTETHPDVYTVCYGVLGCFSTLGAYTDYLRRPFQALPAAPHDIGTKFSLFTRQHRDKAYDIHGWNTTGLRESDFDSSRKTKFIVHGYLNDKRSFWISQMKDNLLKVGDFNVIVVDWLFGAVDFYQQSAVNTRVVGAEIWYLVTRLQAVKGLRNQDIHIIGHSLGAHVAGYAGARLPGLARISGLDPAQPYFQGTKPVVRLDPSDAEFVDVIHTDAKSFFKAVGTGGYGMAQACGHVDFYPNGGRDQPQCSTEATIKAANEVGLAEGLRMYLTCNHMRAVYLYTESIIDGDCDFTAQPCPDYERFQSGKCAYCGRQCARMGYYADQLDRKLLKSSTSNIYYLETGGFPKYCRHNYVLTLKTGDMTGATGRIYAGVQDSSGVKSGMHEITDGPADIYWNEEVSFVLKTNVTINENSTLALEWKPKHTLLGWGILGKTGKELLHLDSVTVEGPRLRAQSFQDRVIWPSDLTKDSVKLN